MTRDEAEAMLTEFLAAHGVRGGPVLNGRDLGSIIVVDARLYFEYHPPDGTLACGAFIERFAEPPGPATLAALRQKATTEDTGGGELDFQPENRGLFLSRTYDRTVPSGLFLSDMWRLGDAAREWEVRTLDDVLLADAGPSPPPPQAPLPGDLP
jgi:hypothetical protein